MQLFAKVYPELVEEFNDGEAAKLSKKSSKLAEYSLLQGSSTQPVTPKVYSPVQSLPQVQSFVQL